MKERTEETNVPQITTYRTLDSTSSFSHRGNLQRITQLPVAEVAPIPKVNMTNDSSISHPTLDKSNDDLQQHTLHQSMKKIESSQSSTSNTELIFLKYITICLFIALSARFSFPREKFQNQADFVQPFIKHNFEIKKKVWNVDTNDTYSSMPSEIYGIDVSGERVIRPSSTKFFLLFQYRHEYLKQQEEIQSLREIIFLKDNRIRLLEDELHLLKLRLENPEKVLSR